MPPSLVTAVETLAKYFARVENQQKWRDKQENQDKRYLYSNLGMKILLEFVRLAVMLFAWSSQAQPAI